MLNVYDTIENCNLLQEIPKNKKKRRREDEANSSGKDTEESSIKVPKGTSEGIHENKKTQLDDPRIWRMADPTLIPSNLTYTEPFANVPRLIRTLNDNLEQNRIKSLFPVQAAVIRWILNRISPKILVGGQRDMCVSSPTGSGKTLSYVLPILHLLSMRFVPRIQALIVVPTQDLAFQVWNVFNEFARGTGLKIGVAAGGDVKLQEEQLRLIRKMPTGELESKVDILVSTPGRLVEHLKNTTGFSLEYLKFLVIDEADNILEKKHNSWLDHVNNHIKDKVGTKNISSDIHHLMFQSWPQKLLFSATLGFDVQQFDSLNLCRPKFIIAVTEDSEIGREYCVSANISEHFIVAETHLKILVLYDLVVEKKWEKILIFTNSNEEAHRLAFLLNSLLPSVKVAELTRFQSLKERTEAIKKFALGVNHILVTCDRMARGIDFPGVKYVISYDPAKYFRTYVHRAGRTGRAGLLGHYITILGSFQAKIFNNKMVNLNRTNISEIKLDFSRYEDKLEDLQYAIEKLSKKVKSDLDKLAEKMKSGKSTKQAEKKKKRIGRRKMLKQSKQD